MLARSWFDALKSRLTRTLNRQQRRASGQRGPATRRLRLEALEERRVLAFVAPVSYDVGTNPQAVLTADFNNDTFPDLAVANSSSSTVSVLLGSADGTFQSAINSRTDTDAGAGVGPRSLAVGDFDGDGNTDDIATVNNNDVSILLGNGNGTLLLAGTINLPAQTVPGNADALPQTPLSVAVGDLTGDGLLDLAVTGLTSFTTRNGPYTYYYYWGGSTTYYTYESHVNGHVNVLIGDGVGNFTPPAADAVQLLAGSYPISVVLEELDSVPGLDLATADYYGNKVRVLSGNNDGTFDAAVDYSTNWNPTSVLTGDVNGDGISDLVTANYYSASVLLGNGSAGLGDGTFQSAQNTSLNFYPTSLAVGDINDDGTLDLGVTSNVYTPGFYTYYPDPPYYYWNPGFYTGQVNVLLGYGDGSFASPTSHVLAAGTYASGLAVGDFNGDGLPDVAVTNSDADPDSGNVSVFINAGGWVLPAKLTISDATVTEGDSGTVEAVFTVTRSGNLAGEVSVNYGTADGGALAGSDYVAQSGTLTFADGVTTMTITILVNGDLTDEYDQGFYVNLSAATGADIANSPGFGTIVDNDLPPTITITAKVSAKEGNNNSTKLFNFIVTLSAASEKYVYVNYATANGTATTADNDYVAKSGTLTFTPGVTSQTIAVTVKGDKRKEANETFFVNLSSATNATIASAQGMGEILDDDSPPGKGR